GASVPARSGPVSGSSAATMSRWVWLSGTGTASGAGGGGGAPRRGRGGAVVVTVGPGTPVTPRSSIAPTFAGSRPVSDAAATDRRGRVASPGPGRVLLAGQPGELLVHDGRIELAEHRLRRGQRSTDRQRHRLPPRAAGVVAGQDRVT